MKDIAAQNRASRDAVLDRVRRALGKAGLDDQARADAQAYVDAHAHGPRPSMPPDVVQRFVDRATDMASTVERIASPADIPSAVARYLGALKLPPSLAMQESRSGVCWPEFGQLDWRSVGLDIEARPTVGDDRTEEYLNRLNAHNEAVRATCQRLGAGYRSFDTNRSAAAPPPVSSIAIMPPKPLICEVASAWSGWPGSPG